MAQGVEALLLARVERGVEAPDRVDALGHVLLPFGHTGLQPVEPLRGGQRLMLARRPALRAIAVAHAGAAFAFRRLSRGDEGLPGRFLVGSDAQGVVHQLLAMLTALFHVGAHLGRVPMMGLAARRALRGRWWCVLGAGDRGQGQGEAAGEGGRRQRANGLAQLRIPLGGARAAPPCAS